MCEIEDILFTNVPVRARLLYQIHSELRGGWGRWIDRNPFLRSLCPGRPLCCRRRLIQAVTQQQSQSQDSEKDSEDAEFLPVLFIHWWKNVSRFKAIPKSAVGAASELP